MDTVEYMGDGVYRCKECGREYIPMEGRSTVADAVRCSDDCPKNEKTSAAYRMMATWPGEREY